MKPILNNLNEALTYHLEGMYDAEKKLQKSAPDYTNCVTSRALKSEIKKYFESARDKRIKLKRIFSYLLAGPFGRKSKVIDKMLKDVDNILKYASSPELKDAMVIPSLQAIIHYKIASYGAAKAFAIVLELETVTDLLEEVLELEMESDRALAKIAIEGVNGKAAAINLDITSNERNARKARKRIQVSGH